VAQALPHATTVKETPSTTITTLTFAPPFALLPRILLFPQGPPVLAGMTEQL